MGVRRNATDGIPSRMRQIPFYSIEERSWKVKTVLARDVPTHSGTCKKGTPVLILHSFQDRFGILLNNIKVNNGPVEIHGLVATAIECEQSCNQKQDN